MNITSRYVNIDNGYDSKEIYNYFTNNVIETIIPLKKNAVTRAKIVMEIKRIGEEGGEL